MVIFCKSVSLFNLYCRKNYLCPDQVLHLQYDYDWYKPQVDHDFVFIAIEQHPNQLDEYPRIKKLISHRVEINDCLQIKVKAYR